VYREAFASPADPEGTLADMMSTNFLHYLHCVHEIHLEMCPQSSFKLTLMAVFACLPAHFPQPIFPALELHTGETRLHTERPHLSTDEG
jgi:hypothetical protein